MRRGRQETLSSDSGWDARDREGRPRLHTLTQMRFFAAFTVMLMHAWWPFMGHLAPIPLRFGYLAVGFFFILSGLVLSYSWAPGTAVVVQWRRRLARIVPLHWLMTVVIALMFLSDRRLAPPGTLTWQAFFAHMTLRQAWPDYQYFAAFNAPSWSLSTELFFYAIFPLVIPLVARLNVGRLLVLAFGSTVLYELLMFELPKHSVVIFSQGGMRLFPPLQFLKFLVGVCLGCALRKGWRPRLRIAPCVLVLATAVAALSYVPRLGTDVSLGLRLALPDAVTLLPIIAVIMAGAARDLRARAASSRSKLLVALGAESFALYLVHWVLMDASILIRLHTKHYAAPGAGWLCVYLVCAVLAARLLHRLYERPLERLLRGSRTHRRAPSRQTPLSPSARRFSGPRDDHDVPASSS
jgi:peptidoglycan/LPS O-acetylase OafA/YrhL